MRAFRRGRVDDDDEDEDNSDIGISGKSPVDPHGEVSRTVCLEFEKGVVGVDKKSRGDEEAVGEGEGGSARAWAIGKG